MSSFAGTRGFERGRGRGRGHGRGRWKHRGRGRGWGRGMTSSQTTTDEWAEGTVQSLRRGLTGGARELCERYIRGPCYCSRLHHQKKAPYVWQYRVNNGDWKLLSNSEMESVEESFCDNNDSTLAEVTLHGNSALSKVNFEEILDPQQQSSFNQCSFRRLSTRSYVEAGTDDISRYTQWVWYWQDNDKVWWPFKPPELQLTLEIKYLAGQDTYLYSIGDHDYRLDFTFLVQVNRKNLTRRLVQRRPMFVSLHEARSCLQKCLLMSPAAVPPTDVPSIWTPLDRYQRSEKVELDTSSDEFIFVMELIYDTLSANRCQVQRIYRLQNALLLHSFRSKRKILQMLHGTESINEIHLFHGTDNRDVVNNICINNFDFRVSGKHGTAYGKGAYFARDAMYSHRFTKGRNRYMFLARVLVGKYTLGNSSYSRPPPRKGHVLYDSCVNDINNPSIFVIFELNQCYPEYLVKYRDGTVGESVSVSRSVGKVTRSSSSASSRAKTAPIPYTSAPPDRTPAGKHVNPSASSSGYSTPSPSIASVSTHRDTSVGSGFSTNTSSVSTSNASSCRARASPPDSTLVDEIVNPPASSSGYSTPRASSESVSTHRDTSVGSSSSTYPSSVSISNASSFRTRASPPDPALVDEIVNPPASSSGYSTPRPSLESVSTHRDTSVGSGLSTNPSSVSSSNASSFRTEIPPSNQPHSSAKGRNPSQFPVSQKSLDFSSSSSIEGAAFQANDAQRNTWTCMLM